MRSIASHTIELEAPHVGNPDEATLLHFGLENAENAITRMQHACDTGEAAPATIEH